MRSKTSNRQLAPEVVFFLVIMFMTSIPVNSTTCQEALGHAAPCIKYALGAAPLPPSPECCKGVDALADIMAFVNDGPKILCRCYHEIPPSVGVKSELAKKVTLDCGYQFDTPTEPGADCNSIWGIKSSNGT
ncbi:non-specific lipid-transfer protein-like [Syzygium oleosum]|uniref:non-specific lipid-transfer protein-like n=1 Tax=Syzygium oleosum TaxID=219896 RepID=UPI0024BA02A9|nr:non-specific lipid-transfer protein-like [Syzygium oleosum]